MIQRVLIIAGGTGGHIFPGLSVAKQLLQDNKQVYWLGTPNGLESELIPKENIPFFQISAVPLRGKGILHLIKAPFLLIKALIQALKIIQHVKPDVVLGMGGFVTGPGGLAAFILRKRLVIHEQNAVPGLANKWLSHFSSRILTGFPLKNKANSFNPSKTIFVGNPVRPDIADLPEPEERLAKHGKSFHLLIIGGSQGAKIFNQVLPEALKQFPNETAIEIWHQTGPKAFKKTQESYKQVPFKAKIQPFFNDMKAAYDWADLIICRAGASTIAEISAVGMASILVPFPLAVDDHQTANARFLVEKNAAILIRQDKFSTDELISELTKFIDDRKRVFTMSQEARTLRKVDATECVIRELYNG